MSFVALQPRPRVGSDAVLLVYACALFRKSRSCSCLRKTFSIFIDIFAVAMPISKNVCHCSILVACLCSTLEIVLAIALSFFCSVLSSRCQEKSVIALTIVQMSWLRSKSDISVGRCSFGSGLVSENACHYIALFQCLFCVHQHRKTVSSALFWPWFSFVWSLSITVTCRLVP